MLLLLSLSVSSFWFFRHETLTKCCNLRTRVFVQCAGLHLKSSLELNREGNIEAGIQAHTEFVEGSGIKRAKRNNLAEVERNLSQNETTLGRKERLSKTGRSRQRRNLFVLLSHSWNRSSTKLWRSSLQSDLISEQRRKSPRHIVNRPQPDDGWVSTTTTHQMEWKTEKQGGSVLCCDACLCACGEKR